MCIPLEHPSWLPPLTKHPSKMDHCPNQRLHPKQFLFLLSFPFTSYLSSLSFKFCFPPFFCYLLPPSPKCFSDHEQDSCHVLQCDVNSTCCLFCPVRPDTQEPFHELCLAGAATVRDSTWGGLDTRWEAVGTHNTPCKEGSSSVYSSVF